MIKSCSTCGGLYATDNLESFAGTPCRCRTSRELSLETTTEESPSPASDSKSSESASVHQPDVQAADASRVERLEAQIKGLMNCMANDQQEIQRLRESAKTAKDFIEVINKDIYFIYSPVTAKRMAWYAEQVLTQLAAALTASPVQPEVWVTCADCGQKRALSSLESRDTFVCRYCLSTKAVQVDEVSKEQDNAEG